MNLTGQLRIDDDSYIIYVNYKTGQETYYCYATIRTDDYLNYQSGDAVKIVQSVQDISGTEEPQSYLIGVLNRSKITGKLKSYGSTSQIEILLSSIQAAMRYKFDDSLIYLSDKSTDLGKTIEQFGAEDDRMSFLFVKKDDIFSSIKLKYGTTDFDLKETKFRNPVSKVQLTEVTNAEKKIISRATVDVITFETLSETLDMSWYKKEGQVLKDYRSVKTINEFEQMFGELCHDIEYATDTFHVSLDTETTGLNIYNLSPDNPDRDHCVAIPISWKDNSAYVVFTDMQEFTNVPNDYAFKRLESLFSEYASGTVEYVYHGKKCTLEVDRKKINLIGHNSPFDRRVAYGENHRIWFDDDTLQMGFCINPTVVRGTKKLKVVTRILFGHETPELEDVLGRGNEDKYRYLVDEEVARIYGGADADYTRKCFFVLKEMLGRKMYLRYKSQDVKMLNILAISEFYGMNTEVEQVKKLGEQVYENIKILENAIYTYVGSYMDYNQKMSILKGQLESGMLTEEEYQKAVLEVVPDNNAKYEFKISGAGLREVLYDILKYPVVSRTDTGIPKVDKYVRKKLLREDRKENSTAKKLNRSILKSGCSYEEYERLLNGNEADKKKADSMVLVNKDDFNKKEYPLAILLDVYAAYQKEYTAYYKPLRETNLEGKLFKSYSLARIETRRIQNPLQTIKKDLKQLVIPYSDDYYLLDFDMSQVEYRAMASLAGAKALVMKMKDPEKDYHVETAAMINGIAPYKVIPKQRKAAKTVSFGQPYGLGERSLTETMHGEINDNNLFDTRMVISKWKSANHQIVDYLETNRDATLDEVQISLDKRNFMDAWKRDKETREYLLDENGNKIPKPLGAVYNKLGFCRYFDLSEVDNSAAAKRRREDGKYTGPEGSIRRAAGNYPVQSFAAELFRTILYRFYDRCEEEGINDKVIWHMLIHDELLCSVHKSINPFYIYKIVKEACMITMAGHTNYFVGINIGNTWEECKDDAREAPVLFVEDMIKKWDAKELPLQERYDNPWEYIKPYREEYIKNRIHDALKQVVPDIDDGPIVMSEVFEKFDNYTVRAYVNDYPKNFVIPSGLSPEDKDDIIYLSRFESWVLDYYGEGKEIIDLSGKQYAVHKETLEDSSEHVDDFLDFDEDDFLDDYDMFDLEEGAIVSTYYSELEEYTEDNDDGIEFRYDIPNCTNVAQMEIRKKKYQNIKLLNGCVLLKLDNRVQESYLKSILKTCRDGGYIVMFQTANSAPVKWLRISETTNLFEIDDMITKLRDIPKNANAINDRLIFSVGKSGEVDKLKRFTHENHGNGYKILLKDSIGKITLIGNVKPNADFSILKEM